MHNAISKKISGPRLPVNSSPPNMMPSKIRHPLPNNVSLKQKIAPTPIDIKNDVYPT